MNIVTIIFITILVLYIILGLLLWRVGLSIYGGKEAYKLSLKVGFGDSYSDPFTYYLVKIGFLIFWPLWIRKNGEEDE